jgi:hypothetical protein
VVPCSFFLLSMLWLSLFFLFGSCLALVRAQHKGNRIGNVLPPFLGHRMQTRRKRRQTESYVCVDWETRENTN